MTPSDEIGAIGRFLSLGDTAEILGLSVQEAADLVLSGELPAIRVGSGHLWRVERSVLQSYIDAKYEETRRLNLWLQSAYTDIPELSGGRVLRPASDRSDTDAP